MSYCHVRFQVVFEDESKDKERNRRGATTAILIAAGCSCRIEEPSERNGNHTYFLSSINMDECEAETAVAVHGRIPI